MNEFSFLTDLYENIYDWLANATPGEHNCKRYFSFYDKKVWNIIKQKMVELEALDRLSKIQKEFLSCKYIGTAYRKINYRKKRKGHVYLTNSYQSCSKTITGLNNVNISGDVILIEMETKEESYAIDVMKLLIFMCKYNLIIYKDEFVYNFKQVNRLEKYYEEEEVVIPINEENIKNICIKNFDTGKVLKLDKENWYRNTFS